LRLHAATAAAESAAPERRMRVGDNDEDERRKKVKRTENNRVQTSISHLPVLKDPDVI